VADRPPTNLLGRSLYEFRRFWELYRVRGPIAVLNLAAVAAGLALSWHETLSTQIVATVGAMAGAAAISVIAVLLLSLAVSSRRILADRVTALEDERASVPGEAGPTIYVQVLGDVTIRALDRVPRR
jgi:hypothetical protein